VETLWSLPRKEESEKPRKAFLKYLFLPVDEVRRVWWRIVVFDGQMWKHFEVFQGEEESEKPRKPVLKCRFLLRRNLVVHKDKCAEVKILWKRMSPNCQRRNYFPSLEFVGLQRYRWGWCAWWRIVVFWDDFEDEEIDNISYDDKHTLSETYIESSRDESLESDSCW
jgi:hypothetical protein